MPSIRERVRFTGILRSEGQEAECTVWATKVSLPGSNAVAYAKYSIQSVSKPLPDGNYTLTVNGEQYAVRCHNGNWLAASAV